MQARLLQEKDEGGNAPKSDERGADLPQQKENVASGGLEESKRIISNQPNAESLNSHHDRKSSAVVRDIISGKSSKSREQIARILNEGSQEVQKEQSKDIEEANLGDLQINADFQPIELTKEEEQYHAEARVGGLKSRIRDSSLQNNAGRVRDISPDQLLAR